MASYHLVSLDSDDLRSVGKIINKVPGVSTPEAAVKWALQHYASQWTEKATVKVEWDRKPAVRPVKMPAAPVPPTTVRIPLGTHHLGVYKVRLKELSHLSDHIVVGHHTLERLVPNKTARANLLATTIAGKIST